MKHHDFSDKELTEPISAGIICRRIGDQVATNVPHLVTHHSPDGYEFGYGGSGPADLALNICEIILNRLGYEGERTPCFDGDCWSLAWQIHQDFKRDFIAVLDHDNGGIIPYTFAEQWVKARIEAMA